MAPEIMRKELPEGFRHDLKGLARGYHMVEGELGAKRTAYGLRLQSSELGLTPERLKALVDEAGKKLMADHGVLVSYRPKSETVEIENQFVTSEEAKKRDYYKPVHAAFKALIELAREKK